MQQRLALALLMSGLAVLFSGGCFKDKPPVSLVTVATESSYPPFEFKDSKQRLTGFDIELIEAIAEAQGFTLTYVDMPFDEVLHAVEHHKVDLAIAGITVTPERKQKVSFSHPYINSSLSLTVHKSFSGQISTLKEAQQLWICAEHGTNGYDMLVEMHHRHVVPCANNTECNQFYVGGQCEAILRDRWVADYILHKEILSDAKVISLRHSFTDMAVAVPRDNQQVLELINDGIVKLENSGKLQELRERWFGAPDS